VKIALTGSLVRSFAPTRLPPGLGSLQNASAPFLVTFATLAFARILPVPGS
jgi:hypothetical protein